MPATPYGENNPNVPPETLVTPPAYTAYGQQHSNQPPPFSGYAPPPPPYNPNPYEPSWAPTQASINHRPIPPSNQLPHQELPQQPYSPPSPEPKKMNNQLKILLIGVAALIVLAGVGGSIFVYTLTRPQPFISVNSQYEVNMTPAGSTSTNIQVSGHKFSHSSSITFLLDGKVVPGNPAAQSDNSGNVTATLTVTSDWLLGDHTLTARDASGYTTKEGIALKIVPQGQAHTPGPNAAPSDDSTFRIDANYLVSGKLAHHIELDISGNPDPKAGSVCTPTADNSQYTQNGQDDIGTYTDTYSFGCNGTYKEGKLSFNEMLTTDKYEYTNGVICKLSTPYVYIHLEGTFSNATSINGSYSRDNSKAYDCTQGASLSYIAEQGNWTGQVKH